MDPLSQASTSLCPLPNLAQLPRGPIHLNLPVLPVFYASWKELQVLSKLPHCLVQPLFSDSGSSDASCGVEVRAVYP